MRNESSLRKPFQDLLGRACAVSVETMKIGEEMGEDVHGEFQVDAINEADVSGRANLRISGGEDKADREIGVHGIGTSRNANQEIGDPGEPYWHSRGYLPHFEDAERIQHVTFHLADSLPKVVLEGLEAELKNLATDKQSVEKRKRIEAWMDSGYGSCVLQEAGIARMVQNSLLWFDGQRYRLLAWVIMPNHVHVLFQPLNGWTVEKIVASWKKFTARKICDYWKAANREIGGNSKYANQEIGDPGGSPMVWHREYWDRYMRDEHHLLQTMEYIHQNPVKAGLVSLAEGWLWGSVGYANQKADQEIGDPGPGSFTGEF